MAMTSGTLTAQDIVQITASYTPSAVTSTTALNPIPASQQAVSTITWQYGTGSGQVDIVVDMYRTLAASGNEELDLYDGVTNTPDVIDVFGFAIAGRKIKYIRIEMVPNSNGSTPATGLTIGNASSNPNKLWFGGVTETQSLEYGGMPFCQGSLAGKTVDATHRGVKVLNTDASNASTYRLSMGLTSV